MQNHEPHILERSLMSLLVYPPSESSLAVRRNEKCRWHGGNMEIGASHLQLCNFASFFRNGRRPDNFWASAQVAKLPNVAKSTSVCWGRLYLARYMQACKRRYEYGLSLPYRFAGNVLHKACVILPLGGPMLQQMCSFIKPSLLQRGLRER